MRYITVFILDLTSCSILTICFSVLVLSICHAINFLSGFYMIDNIVPLLLLAFINPFLFAGLLYLLIKYARYY